MSAAVGAAEVAPGPLLYDWNGLYAGGFIGYADISTNGFFATSLDLTFGGGGILGGARVGWNWQKGSLVLGVEHDASWMEWGATNLREEQYVTTGDFLSTMRARIGWADDNVLFFITGGAAFLHAGVDTSLGGADPDQVDNEDYKDVSAVGGVAGAGVEWGVSRNLSITAEGQYLFFNGYGDLSGLEEGLPAGPFNDGVNPPIPAGVPANFFAIDDGFIFRIGVNWRLWNPNGNNNGSAGAIENYAGISEGPYEWGGFYLGSHVGIGRLDPEGVYDNTRLTEVTNNPAPIILDEFNSMGLAGGVQAGYNMQSGRFVAGIEADVSGADWDDLITDLQRPSSPQAEQLDIGLLGTLRGRVGVTYEDLLLYVTGGLAVLRGEYNDITFDASKDLFSLGAVYGAGIEWGMTPNLSLRAEALKFDFNDVTSLEDMPSGKTGDHLKLTDSMMFRVGANWHLSPSAGADNDAMLRGDYDWTGIYGGAHVGWGGIVTEGVYNTDPLPNQAVDLTTISDLGLLGGGQAGINWQSGPLVFGVEGDLSYVDWSGREGVFYSPAEYVQFNSDMLATLRGRLGYADDNLLFYLTAGFAWLDAEIDNSANLGGSYVGAPVPVYTPDPNDPGEKRNIDALGGVAGLGMEWGITQNLSAKVEGQYIFFNDVHHIDALGSEGDPGDFFQIDDGFAIQLGVNYRFNPFYEVPDYTRRSTNGLTAAGPGVFAEPRAMQAANAEVGADEEAGSDEEQMGWALSGILNRATVVWDDGDQVAINSVDNPQDSSAVEAEYKHLLSGGWKAVFNTVVDAYWVGGDTVDQLDWEGTGAIVALPYLFGSVEHESWGRVIVGMADSASDEIDNINLAGADVVSDASFDNFAAGYFLRAKNIPGAGGLATGLPNGLAGELRWGDILDGKIAGDSGRFITYVSPDWQGFEASAAIGLPTEIFLNFTDRFLYTERTNGMFWDVALRYAGQVGSDFRVEGGIGYWNDTTEEKLAVEPTEDQGVGGSLAIRHVPTGLNLAVNFGTEDHTDNCADPGIITGKCAGPDTFLNLKGGIVDDYFSFGSTAFYGEYYKNWKNQHDSDEDLVATLFDGDPAPDPAELKSSEVTGWGLGVVQRIESADTDLYLGFRNYQADFNLVDQNGKIETRAFEDFMTVTAGVTFHWGGK